MIKVLVLDFDGVILESVAVKDQAIYDLFEDASPEERQRVLDLHRQTPGINRRERVTILLTQGLGREVNPEEVDRLLDRFAKLAWEGLMNCPEVPGVKSFLEDIYKEIPCYVVSAAPQDEVRAVAKARDFSRYFVDIYGTPPGKVELLKEITSREQVFADSLLFIGDKLSDFKAAQKSNVKFIGRQLDDNFTVFPKEVTVVIDFEKDYETSISYIKDFRI